MRISARNVLEGEVGEVFKGVDDRRVHGGHAREATGVGMPAEGASA